MKYTSGGAFRRALEERLRTTSIQRGVSLVRLRKMVAFDRFLARLIRYQPDQWVVKGGLALQLRLRERARTTKDIDVRVITQIQAVYPALKTAGALDLGDWFSFDVTQPKEQTPGDFGGVRIPIHTLLDGRAFENFHVDVGIGDPMIEAADYLTTPPMLEFAGLEPVRVPCYPLTQQIAEKLHAYTRPRSSGESSRVKDFIDILLLAEFGEIYSDSLLEAIQATFQFANTHPLPENIPPPPGKWVQVFLKGATEVGLGDITLNWAFTRIQNFLDPALSGKVVGNRWDSTSWSWKPA